MLLELLVVIVCGIGTFLLRFLPIWRVRRRVPERHSNQLSQVNARAQRFFAGIGPAALSALLLVSLWPFFDDAGNARRMFSVVAALTVVYASKRLLHSLAGPTLLGAVVYGALMHWAAV